MKPALVFLACAAPLAAQLAPPNASGVTMGHVHFKTTSLPAHRRLWVDVLGAKPGKLGAMDMYKIPGTVVLVEPGQPSAGSQGGVIREIGFKVPDLKATLGKAKAAGVVIQRELPESHQAFLTAPDNVDIELTEDTGMTGVAACHHIHFLNNAVKETQAWYAKTFGAKPGKRANFDAADLPGVNLTFSESPTATAPIKGRALDHIGFEVRNLQAYCKKLEAGGVKFDIPYRNIPTLGVAIAFFTDPWGTYIELTEGLDKL